MPSIPNLKRCLFTSAASLAFAASNASATWSILIVDTRTGEIVIASATCVASIDLRRSTPVLITGVGAVTAQSAVDITGRNRMIIRDRLLQGVPLQSILDELADTDTGHDNRQYGIITADGQTLTYSGIDNADWAGGITGRIERGQLGPADDIVYTVQGNILSGPNVVQDAVDAIINTDTDLPGRLKAAMLAAQVGGGDGRCSCNNADPTGCGSPPPGPFKSAHVGYMLGARLDDIDAVPAFYPISGISGGMATLDINHDGMEDVVIGDDANDEISIFLNTAHAGDPISHMLKQESITLGASHIVAMSTGDFNNDGYDDVAIALSTPPTLAILLGQASGSLGDPITLALPAAPTGLTAAKLDAGSNDKIIVSQGSIDIVQSFYLLNDHITQGGNINITGNPSTVIAADVVGNSDLDIIVARRDLNTVWIGENRNKDGFIEAANIPTANQPSKLVAADMDSDGDNELIILSGSGRRVEVFADSAKGWVQTNDMGINQSGIGLTVGDFDGDTFPDIITTSSRSGRNLQVFTNDGVGGFTISDTARVGNGATNIKLIDMNANGDLDIVIANFGAEGLLIHDNPRGTSLSRAGRFADGDYFLELNIANQRADDPDPVDQLIEGFDLWRIDLAGKVDAVQSAVIGRHRVLSFGSTTITVELRDWQDQLLPISDPGAWLLQDANGLFSATDPILVEPGIFEIDLIGHETLGQDELIIRVGSGADQIRLMPNYPLFFVHNIADFTADGRLNFFDISAFLIAYGAQSPDADINGDGFFNAFDISAFLAAFADG